MGIYGREKGQCPFPAGLGDSCKPQLGIWPRFFGSYLELSLAVLRAVRKKRPGEGLLQCQIFLLKLFRAHYLEQPPLCQELFLQQKAKNRERDGITLG